MKPLAKCVWMVWLFLLPVVGMAQPFAELNDSAISPKTSSLQKQFISTYDFLDAAISSLNALNSLIKKENYRTRVTSLNNPTTSDMGFSLENEVQTALKPLLAKAKNTSPTKFSQVVSSLLSTQKSSPGVKNSLALVNPVFPTLLSLVGNLAINEKKITREDLDSFITVTSKYFVQYEKLNAANLLFDQNIDKMNAKMKDLQFDLKEYMLDMVVVLNPQAQRSGLKSLTAEELLLKYLDKYKIEEKLPAGLARVKYPSDGIKGAKEISSTLQKLFTEYQKIYADNYQQIRTVLAESKSLAKTVNSRQVEFSLKDLEELYNDSKASDMLSLRLSTLGERLKQLVSTEQGKK